MVMIRSRGASAAGSISADRVVLTLPATSPVYPPSPRASPVVGTTGYGTGCGGRGRVVLPGAAQGAPRRTGTPMTRSRTAALALTGLLAAIAAVATVPSP